MFSLSPGVDADIADTLVDDLAGGDIAYTGDVDIVGELGGPTPEEVADYWSHGFGGPSIHNSAEVIQRGDRNVSNLTQAGFDNEANLHQTGRYNNAAMIQGGSGNSLTLIQHGNGLRILVGQKGAGRSATIIQTN